MHIDRALIDIDVAPPHAVEQLRAAEHASRALHQELEQPELGRSEMDLAPVSGHPVRLAVERDIADAQHRGDALGARTPEDGADARHQLGQRERLDDIIVGACGKPPDAVALLAPRGEQENRDGAAFFARAQAPAQLDAGDARQHPVEHDQIGRALGDGHFGLIAAMDDIDFIAFCFEVIAQEERERLFVLDNQDFGSGADRVHRGYAPIVPTASAERPSSSSCRPSAADR